MAIERWSIDPLHTDIGFTIRHMVVSKVRGRFTRWEGDLELDESDLSLSRVTVKIDAASIDTGVEQRDNHLRSPDFFDAPKYPALTFVSRKVERAGGERFKVTGDLTIRDVTREVVLDVEASGTAKDPWGGTRAGFTARTSLDRTDFGLTYNQVLEAGHLLVGNRIDVEIEIEAIKAGARQAA